jgi:outer membrane protein OmpA-like peptidoglycan-associated protein
LEFAAGVTARLSALASFYAQAGYEFAVGNADGGRRQDVKGNFGVRLTFGQPPPPPAPGAVPAAATARSYLVFFDWDKATLTDRARRIIREAADNSTHVQFTRIEVNGYTTRLGPRDTTRACRYAVLRRSLLNSFEMAFRAIQSRSRVLVKPISWYRQVPA